MAEYKDREHYIPLRKSDLVDLLCADKQMPLLERAPFRQFCRLVSATFHFEYLQKLEELKDAYAPFDPDSETRPLKPLLPEEKVERRAEVFEAFARLMERANFKKLEPRDLDEALHSVPSDWGVATDVELGLFERLEIYARGESRGNRSRRRWQRLWWKEEISLPLYQRLVVIAKLRPHSRLEADIATEPVYMKIFKAIPKTDLEMLLMGARPRLSKLDRALIAYPLALGVGLALYGIGSSIWAAGLGALASLATWSLAMAFGGYGYRSWYSYQVKKQTYTLRLTRSLYYLGLDSNSGVLMRLLDEAEEQECRETFLAYYFLWKHAPPQGWTSEQLDDYVELYLEGTVNLKVDFEIGDALDKLERLKIVRKTGALYTAVALDKALEMLDWTWDNYFKYNNPEPEEPPIP